MSSLKARTESRTRDSAERRGRSISLRPTFMPCAASSSGSPIIEVQSPAWTFVSSGGQAITSPCSGEFSPRMIATGANRP